MTDDQNRAARSSEEQDQITPPDLILQAIVPPTDAPAEIRAAVAAALARGVAPTDGGRHSWEDVSFAASALAFVEGTDQRAEPPIQWVFALNVEAPRLGQRVRSYGHWSSAVSPPAFSDGTGRTQWQAVLYESVRTEPRPRPGPAEA